MEYDKDYIQMLKELEIANKGRQEILNTRKKLNKRMKKLDKICKELNEKITNFKNKKGKEN